VPKADHRKAPPKCDPLGLNNTSSPVLPISLHEFRLRDARHAQRLDSQVKKVLRPGWRDISLRQHPPGAGMPKKAFPPPVFLIQAG
jgi:hypothetical protein